MGFFENMFDFNHDGRVDMGEEFMGFIGFQQYRKACKRSRLTNAGLDWDDLSDMDEDERNDLLEENGLDPDDFDDLND